MTWKQIRGRVVGVSTGIAAEHSGAAGLRRLRERVDAERALAESEHRYRMLVEHSADVVASATMDGTIDWISESVQQLSGRPPAAYIGHRFLDFLHPDDVAHVQELQPALLRGETVFIEARLSRADGTWCWISSHVRPLLGDDGQVIGRVANWRDIEAEHEARTRLERSEAFFRLLADNSEDVVVRFGANFDIEWVSPSVERVLGWTPEQLLAIPSLDLVLPEDLPVVRRGHAELQTIGRTAYRTRFKHSNGEFRWLGVRAAAFHDASGAMSGVTASWRDIDAEVASEQHLQRLAAHDALTGILNRSEAYAQVAAMLRDTERGQQGIGLLFCDLDNLKALNDSHGHAAGDAVLRALAARISNSVRDDDFVARVGGDEFLIVISQTDDLAEVAGLGERVRAAVQEAVPLDGQALVTTVSIGGIIAHAGDEVDAAIARADRAMYLAKTAGRNRVVVLAD